MLKLMGKEINAILGAQTILIWTYGKPHWKSFVTRKHQWGMRQVNTQSYLLTRIQIPAKKIFLILYLAYTAVISSLAAAYFVICW